jgi:methylated-DNA-[protein]-cysteine S-methyltransferase
MAASNEPLRLAYEEIDSPLGRLRVVTDQAGQLCLSGWLEGHGRAERDLRAYASGRRYVLTRASHPSHASAALGAYFGGELAAIDDLPVAALGTPFQRQVWQALRTIPCGTTLSYGELARRIGNPAAVRAVGLANGANPVGIVVPCHRVIGANGTLTGYGGGLERKRWLLAHERALRSQELPFERLAAQGP